MFKETSEGQTHYCIACEREAKGQTTKGGHTCGRELCGAMIKTPHYYNGHEGGAWCAEKKPCKFHDKLQEKSVEDWEKEFDKWIAPKIINGFYDKFDIHTVKDFILHLQKETDDKWKKKIEEIIGKLKDSEESFMCDCYLEKIVIPLDQATNIIKELVK